jgi:tetratricopeptide (TPR) repeat protein
MLKIFMLFSLWNGFSQEGANKSIESLYQTRQFQSIVREYGAKVLELQRPEQYLLAQSYLNLGNKKMAIRIFEIMIEKHPKDGPAYRKLAEIYRQDKKYKQSIEQLNLAIKMNPHYEAAYLDLAQTILEFKPRNRFESRAIFEEMVEKFGKKPEYMEKICDLASKEGQHQIAEKACSQSLELTPNNSTALIAMGHLIRDKMEYQKADEYFTKLLLEHGRDPNIAVACGDYFKERNQTLKAFEAYEKGVTENEFSPYENIIKAAQLACELQLHEKCYLMFKKACGLSKNAKVELRRAMKFLSSLKDQTVTGKFEKLNLECDKP